MSIMLMELLVKIPSASLNELKPDSSFFPLVSSSPLCKKRRRRRRRRRKETIDLTCKSVISLTSLFWFYFTPPNKYSDQFFQ
jgi:hypothetical protein